MCQEIKVIQSLEHGSTKIQGYHWHSRGYTGKYPDLDGGIGENEFTFGDVWVFESRSTKKKRIIGVSNILLFQPCH